MKFIALKTSDGKVTGKISFYCKCLEVSRQGFYSYLVNRNKPWKYQGIAKEIMEILNEDVYNDTYGRNRIHLALQLKHPDDEIPSQRTIYRIMQRMGIVHETRRKPNGITKADKLARKSDDLIGRNFQADEPMKKCVTDMTEIKAKDGKLYLSVIFDCFDAGVLGLAMAENMKAELCVRTLENAMNKFPDLAGAIIHSDRGAQYTSKEYRESIAKYGIQQSMNRAGGRCHDNARCESMWARMKNELFYTRKKSTSYTVAELKTMIWRYYMSYWNNRRIFPGNNGYPPVVKRQKFYADNCM